MTKLRASDAAFVYAETSDSPMSIASLQILELPADTSVETFVESLKTYIDARKHLVPYLTHKLEWADGVLDHPNWAPDPHFDINWHIYTVPVPAPGDRAALETTVARLHEEPLDRDHPLWDMAVLTGLEGGRIAYYNRLHHACADGVAAQASTQLLMDAEGELLRHKTPLPGSSDRSRSAADHAVSLLTTLAQQAIESLTSAPARAMSLARVVQAVQAPEPGLNQMYAAAPHTSLNKRIDNRRVYATAELPVAAMRNIGRQFGCTVNDVLLAICGDALRRYLARHAELPADTLHAGCPVSLRDARDASSNNQVTMMRVPLATDLADPLARLLAVRAATRQAKTLLAAGADLLPNNVTLPGMGLMLRGAQLGARLTRVADRVAPPFNVVISNVPGPRAPLTSNGARMLTHYPVSIPAEGLGVNITAQSYVDQMYLGITAAMRVLPDADRLRDDLLAAFDALNNAISADVVQLDKPTKAKNSESNQSLNDRADDPSTQVA